MYSILFNIITMNIEFIISKLNSLENHDIMIQRIKGMMSHDISILTIYVNVMFIIEN